MDITAIKITLLICCLYFLGSAFGQRICNCVPYDQCENSTINVIDDGLIDRNSENEDKRCNKPNEICCDKESFVTPIKPNQCGVGLRNDYSDFQAAFGEFPWMVGVLRVEHAPEALEEDLDIYTCGGALIHPGIVLTAAHCVEDKKDNKSRKFKVRAGEWDVSTKTELFPHQNRDVKSIKIHPEFNSVTLFNDLALLVLAEPVEIAQNVNVVCLALTDVVIDRSRCFATGWGTTAKGGKYSSILKKIELQIVNRDSCQDSLRKTRLGNLFELHKSFICAKNEAGVDTCKGDGGPLVCPTTHGGTLRYIQVGIVSWGIGCGEDGIPGAYVDVEQYLDWINEYIPRDFDIK